MSAHPHDAIRWLNPPAPDVVRIEGLASATTAGAPKLSSDTVRVQVARWRKRIRWARGAVVLRRYLAVALALAILGELIARLVGPGTRPLWAFAGVALVVAVLLVVLAMPIMPATVAGMLDRELGLFDSVGTGLELEGRTKGSPMLAAHVVADAKQALNSSFGSARARPRPTGSEWRVVLGLAVVLALLMALPSFGHGGSQSAGTPHHGNSAVGKVHHRGTPAHRQHARHRGHPVGAGVDNQRSNHTDAPPLAISPSNSSGGTYKGGQPYGPAARSLPGGQIAQTGLSETANGIRSIVAPGGAGSGSGGKPSSGNAGGHSSGGSSGAKASGAKGASGGLRAPGAAGGAAPSSTRAGGHGGGTPGKQGGPASNGGSQAGRQQSQGAPPGGENAGRARGSTALGPGLTPDLGTGNSGLPLQAGYAATKARTPGHGGVSQTPNGGGGAARSQSAGGAVGGSSGQAGATPIPPTPNAGAVGTQSLVTRYFGGANQLRPGSW